jgi:flagellar hook assembly protein FlgD
VTIRSIYPNPFNPAVTIVLELDRRRHVEVSVYDVQGRRVRGLFSAVRGPGRHALTWNALDDGGSRVASGVYFIETVSESWRETRKVTVLK